MSDKTIRIATRSSELALKQASIVANSLAQELQNYTFEIVPLTTKGDRILTKPLMDIGGKGLFTKEIEEALLDNRADIAVHSMKDAPSEEVEELEFIAFIDSEDARDALIESEPGIVSRKNNPIIGTCSLRRKYFISQLCPNAKIVDLRGNVGTRIAKLKEGNIDATVLAVAGLKRLGVAEEGYRVFDEDVFIPAICQGIIGIQARKNLDSNIRKAISAINNNNLLNRVKIERSFLRQMNAGCKVAIAGHAKGGNQNFIFRYFFEQKGQVFTGKKEITIDLIEEQIEGIVNRIKDDLL
jgi:hydroxymethylbilane synthase